MVCLPGVQASRSHPYDASAFCCRRCLGLSYPSQLERPWDRCISKIEKICSRLGWCSRVIHGHGEKPLRMAIAGIADNAHRQACASYRAITLERIHATPLARQRQCHVDHHFHLLTR